MVRKRGDKWCVLHAHPQKKGSKTDKPPGTVIKCFDSKKKADSMHAAIVLSEAKKSKPKTSSKNKRKSK